MRRHRSSPPELSGPFPEGEAAHFGLWRQMGLIIRTIFGSPVGKSLMLLVAVMILVVGATAYGQIRLNGWNKPFYDALSRRDLRDFLYQLGVFFMIAGFLLALNVVQRWLVETLELKMREGLVISLLHDWMLPRRAFWLANAGAMGVNPDQRIHEDARKLCELSADLGIGLLQALILFLTFSEVLWVLSKDFVLGGRYGLHGAGLHGLGGHSLRQRRLAHELLGRAGAHPPQCGALCARGGPALLAGAGQRACRRHLAGARAKGDERAAYRAASRQRAGGDPPHRQGPRQSDLGHGGIRLGHHRRAHPRRGAAVFQRARSPSAV